VHRKFAVKRTSWSDRTIAVSRPRGSESSYESVPGDFGAFSFLVPADMLGSLLECGFLLPAPQRSAHEGLAP
jgi:hypothetical protein